MSETRYTLMTPGPVPVPDAVLELLAKPMEHHRTPEFIALFNRVLENLKQVFATQERCFILTSTGSGAMEAALVNTLSPGDSVLAIVSGKFGERWADMAEVFGARVTRLEVPWGEAVRVADIESHLTKNPDTALVLTQACETSSGVLHPIREIAQVTSKHRALLAIDAITALGALPMPMDEWGLDIVIGGSQKAFMLPTGLSFISLSKKAWAKAETAKTPRFYFDLRAERDANENGESMFSSSVTLVRALDLVLTIFLKQGLSRVQERIQTLSRATIEAAREMGLKVFPTVPSPSLTAIAMPEGIDGQKIRADMEKSSHVIVMGGQDQLKGRVIRVGHMGAIRDEDLLSTLEALAGALNRVQADTVSTAQLSAALSRAREILKDAPAVVLDR